jgi:hypothetical protein
MGNLFGKKEVLPAKSESFDSTTVQPLTTYSALPETEIENRETDGRKKRSPKKKRSKKRSLKKKRT